MKNENETRVTGINITVKGQKLTLTVEEARKLKDELVSLLDVRWYPPVVINQPVPYVPYCPPPVFRPYHWEITCGGIGGIGHGIEGFSEMQRLT